MSRGLEFRARSRHLGTSSFVMIPLIREKKRITALPRPLARTTRLACSCLRLASLCRKNFPLLAEARVKCGLRGIASLRIRSSFNVTLKENVFFFEERESDRVFPSSTGMPDTASNYVSKMLQGSYATRAVIDLIRKTEIAFLGEITLYVQNIGGSIIVYVAACNRDVSCRKKGGRQKLIPRMHVRARERTRAFEIDLLLLLLRRWIR